MKNDTEKRESEKNKYKAALLAASAFAAISIGSAYSPDAEARGPKPNSPTKPFQHKRILSAQVEYSTQPELQVISRSSLGDERQ